MGRTALVAPATKARSCSIHGNKVSCPGVHLQAKDDIYLSMCFMSQYRQSKCLPAVFPLLFHEKMMFEKIFRQAVDPGDIAVMLECKLSFILNTHLSHLLL
uniref:Spermatogenesis-associated protein 6 N-terminal domain-containing protein n=1 Tax=Seriola lalandi dorsalis TaxID=1841481 RepID=A0A3B4XNP6_SERLL